MKLSLIINTCSADPLAGPPKYGRRSYQERLTLLREEILPAARGFDEIIVVGQFVEPKPLAGEHWRYLPMQPVYRDRRDALWQREYGARAATGDLLAFSHDDHRFDDSAAGAIRRLAIDSEWDLLVPRRVDRAGKLLNNGRDGDYMGGHSLVMRRWLWALCPWTYVDTEWWDTSMTRVWRADGAQIVWTDEFTHIDMDT